VKNNFHSQLNNHKNQRIKANKPINFTLTTNCFLMRSHLIHINLLDTFMKTLTTLLFTSITFVNTAIAGGGYGKTMIEINDNKAF